MKKIVLQHGESIRLPRHIRTFHYCCNKCGMRHKVVVDRLFSVPITITFEESERERRQ